MASNLELLYSTCVHEAGHSVVATACGVEVTEVFVCGARSGVTRTKVNGKPNLSSAVKLTLAGIGAEKLLDTGISQQDALNGAAADLLWVSGVCPAENLHVMVDRTHKILSDLRNEVEHVACELWVKGSLSGDEVRELLNSWVEE
jgi:hypothetical protein